MNILVLDDDPDIRGLICGVVSSMGFNALPAENGEQALKLHQDNELDLAILDLMVPGVSGAKVCESIKAKSDQEMIPVLVVSAVSEIANKVDLLDSGADDYLTKPFNVNELKARINALLRMRRLNVALHEKNEALKKMQADLVSKERQLAAVQLAGSAAHSLGQPLTAIKLNLHLLETLSPSDVKYKQTLASIKSDLDRMAAILEDLKKVDANKVEEYHHDTKIMKMGDLQGK